MWNLMIFSTDIYLPRYIYIEGDGPWMECSLFCVGLSLYVCICIYMEGDGILLIRPLYTLSQWHWDEELYENLCLDYGVFILPTPTIIISLPFLFLCIVSIQSNISSTRFSPSAAFICAHHSSITPNVYVFGHGSLYRCVWCHYWLLSLFLHCSTYCACMSCNRLSALS